MKANNRTQIVLSHDYSILVSNDQQPPWLQLANLQWSSFIRISFNFALCRKKMSRCAIACCSWLWPPCV